VTESIDRRDDFATQVGRVAALDEPVRRALYEYVVTQDEPVSRNQAAAGIGVATHVAKFHLDKLEEDGLLETEFTRTSGRTGPGAGRPAKVYRRARTEISVSIPERRYELAARIMADAIAAAVRGGASAVPLPEALHSAAQAMGREFGAEARELLGSARGHQAVRTAIVTVLAEQGYEPRVAGDTVTLTNCPFHNLAVEYPELICGLNLDVLAGLVDNVTNAGLAARLDPAPNRCCVTLGPTTLRDQRNG
jgi:predicted ArsR family transcriptional regulator